MKYQIKEMNDYDVLAKLYFDCELEGALEKDFTGKEVKHWECSCKGQIIGGATLRLEETYCVLEFLAVKKEYRGEKIGENLLKVVEDYANGIRIPTIILCAKEPLFYQKYGWKIIEDNRIPMVEHCLECENYKKSCFPEMMFKKVV